MNEGYPHFPLSKIQVARFATHVVVETAIALGEKKVHGRVMPHAMWVTNTSDPENKKKTDEVRFLEKKTGLTPNWSEKYLTLQIHPVFAFKVEFRSMTIIFQKSNLETLTSTFQIKELYYIYLEPVNVLYFGVGTFQKKAFSKQNRGHLGSRYLNLNKIKCYQYIV